MDTTRRTSITTGSLFLIATIAELAAAALVPALTGSDDMTGLAGRPGRLAAAALLYLLAAGTSVGIAIAVYPLLKRVDAALAIGSVAFRTIEAVFYTVAVVSLLSVLTLSQQLETTPPDGRAPTRVSADLLLSVHDHAKLAGGLAFTVGALMYYSVFYRARLVPRWLSAWGIAAVLLMITARLLALFTNSPVTGYTLLILPIAVQEMVLAVWLLAIGFRPPHNPSAAWADPSTLVPRSPNVGALAPGTSR